MAGSAAQLSMSMLRNIVRSYTKPGQVVSDLLQAGPREDRALAFLAAGCVMAFLAQWPGLARQAHLEEKALDMLLGGAPFARFGLPPLLVYILALLVNWVCRVFVPSSSPYTLPVTRFRALLCSSPFMFCPYLTHLFTRKYGLKCSMCFTCFRV